MLAWQLDMTIHDPRGLEVILAASKVREKMCISNTGTCFFPPVLYKQVHGLVGNVFHKCIEVVFLIVFMWMFFGMWLACQIRYV